MAALHTSFGNLEKICAKNPTSILFARLAEGLFRKGDIVRATEICRQGLRYRPSYVAGHVVLGKCHLASGRIEEARQEFQKVLQLDADHPAALFNLGQIDLKLGWEDLALGHFERALVQDPLNADLKAQVAQLRAKHHLPEATAGVDVSDAERPAHDGLDVAAVEEVVRDAEEPTPEAPFEAEEHPEPLLAAADEATAELDAEPAEHLPDFASLVDASDDQPIDEEAAAVVEVEPIATLTLAELYAGQGLIAQAIAVLECIVARDPDNQKIKDRLAELRSADV